MTGSPTADLLAIGGSDGGGDESRLGIVVGATFVVLLVGLVGVYLWKRCGGWRQQYIPPLPPQPQTVSMFVNPIHHHHHGISGCADVEYEEPLPLQPDDSRVKVDSDLYVSNQTASHGDGSYAVFLSARPADATYCLFRSQGVARGPDDMTA